MALGSRNTLGRTSDRQRYLGGGYLASNQFYEPSVKPNLNLLNFFCIYSTYMLKWYSFKDERFQFVDLKMRGLIFVAACDLKMRGSTVCDLQMRGLEYGHFLMRGSKLREYTHFQMRGSRVCDFKMRGLTPKPVEAPLSGGRIQAVACRAVALRAAAPRAVAPRDVALSSVALKTSRPSRRSSPATRAR